MGIVPDRLEHPKSCRLGFWAARLDALLRRLCTSALPALPNLAMGTHTHVPVQSQCPVNQISALGTWPWAAYLGASFLKPLRAERTAAISRLFMPKPCTPPAESGLLHTTHHSARCQE